VPGKRVGDGGADTDSAGVVCDYAQTQIQLPPQRLGVWNADVIEPLFLGQPGADRRLF
ncbi:uncharacterized protein METZ01_LOCUS32007, partial [marine metagenome]